MAAATSKLSIVKLAKERGFYAQTDERMRDADLVIDHRGRVIKDRFGMEGRNATHTEKKNATEINP